MKSISITSLFVLIQLSLIHCNSFMLYMMLPAARNVASGIDNQYARAFPSIGVIKAVVISRQQDTVVRLHYHSLSTAPPIADQSGISA